MAAGEGKGWAKGRSAKDDPRIARAAAGHRGKQYESHVAPELDRRRRGTTPFQPIWTPILAYEVGLIATDGCQSDGRHIGFPSADRELVEILLACLDKRNKISVTRGESGGLTYRTQIGDVRLCRWLLGIGIKPRKSLTIGAVAVPDDVFLPFARGLLDGDGSIMNKTARADVGRRSDYYWEYLQTKFVSASRAHLDWLQGRLHDLVGVDGLIIRRAPRAARHECFTLRYSKHDSHRLLPRLYADGGPRLTRKWRVWSSYQGRHADLLK